MRRRGRSRWRVITTRWWSWTDCNPERRRRTTCASTASCAGPNRAASSRRAPSAPSRRRVPRALVFGSCRTAAPHEPPWTLELADDPRGRGVDALYAHALRMVELPEDEWPDLAVFLGDQVYADDSSPKTRERVKARRQQESDRDERDLPEGHVEGFEEYCWLYHESWSPTGGAVVLLGGAERHDLRRPRHDRRLEHLRVVGTQDPRPARGGPSTSARR